MKNRWSRNARERPISLHNQITTETGSFTVEQLQWCVKQNLFGALILVRILRSVYEEVKVKVNCAS
jgi:hypothetical protein